MQSHVLQWLAGRRKDGRNGFALVLVLAVLVLISVLILSFFSSVTGDLSNTTAAANANGTRELSDNVVQLMEAQITDATTAPVDSGGAQHSYSKGQIFSWASQPGMIRTYDTTGAGLMFYKLYSSDKMRTVWNNAGDYATQIADDLSTSDMQDPAQFTDLNSPVNDSAAIAVYPIADPSSINIVQGFSVTNAPGNVGGVTGNKIPMPVRWLYKLQDGTLVAAPTGGSTGTVDLSKLGASATNPIVGRVAFWTDDETSKVNINTAAEGTYWDTPRFWATSQNSLSTPTTPLTQTPYPDPEYAYAVSQPLRYEFQRYPGHPAQVALSPIFSNLTTYPTASALAMAMTGIAPFLAPGGSQAGTMADLQSGSSGSPVDLAGAARQTPYATVDEFLYGTGFGGGNRTATNAQVITPATVQADKFFITANSRAPELNLFGMPRISCWPIDSTLNLASAPESNVYTTVYDRMIAFCSSLKSGANNYLNYYFQRKEPNSPSYDYQLSRNVQLYSYLQNLTSQNIPGFGGSFLNKYPGQGGVTDRDQILTEIFDYIRCTDLCDAALYNVNPAFTFAVSQSSAANFQANVTFPVTPTVDKTHGTMGFGRMPVVDQIGICLVCVLDGTQGRIDYGKPTNLLSQNTSASLTTPYWDYGQPTVTYSPANEVLIPNYSSIATRAGIPATGLTSTQKVYQAAFVMQGYDPCFGPPDYTPNFTMQVQNLDQMQINGASNVFVNGGNASPTSGADSIFNVHYFGATGGNGVVDGPFIDPTVYAYGHNEPLQGHNGFEQYMTPSAYSSPVPSGSNYYYPCVSKPFLGTAGSPVTVQMPPTLTIKMYTGFIALQTPGRLANPNPNTSVSPGTLYQTITVQAPTPSTVSMYAPILDVVDYPPTPPNQQSFMAYNWGFADRIAGYPTELSSVNTNTPNVYFQTNPLAPSPIGCAQPLWGQKDSVQSWFLVPHGDSRLLAASANPVVQAVLPLGGAPVNSASQPFAHFFRDCSPIPAGSTSYYTAGGDASVSTVPMQTSHVVNLSTSLIPNLPSEPPNSSYTGFQNKYPVDSRGLHVPLMPWLGDPPAVAQNCYQNGDFDNLIGFWADGPGINKPDEGDTNTGQTTAPYWTSKFGATKTQNFFTPNRIIPSPGMFGSLPTGVKSNTPWQTLLFRPQPGGITAPNYYAHSEAAKTSGPSGYYNNNGYDSYTTPPDHLIMDLFWMPIVEPYAISDSFSTAGKINMNYQIQPFTYIDRNTSLICLLKNEKMIAVPDTAAQIYKSGTPQEPLAGQACYRFNINPDEGTGTALNETGGGSLRQFQDRFAAGDIFRSASEICDIFLVPEDYNGSKTTTPFNSDTDAATFWGNHRLTGDNSRERPYTNLYERLTTKSNTFTIHVRVQSLKQSPASRATGKWVETTDRITGEYRGSTLIERYLDPDANLPDYAANTGSIGTTGNLDQFYNFRVVRSTQFAP
jgi:hypothetical protein